MTDRAPAALSKGTAAADALIGRVISGRFRVTSLIARGGMGKVYRAEQAPLGRVCALKVLNPNYAGEHDPEFHKRFFLEASTASKLTHPNTVTIFDYGRTDDDIYYMAMEYLEGITLHRAIRDAGHLPEERTIHIARQICRALREAHSLGVIHRDLKPANIFLVQHGDEADFVKVLDFGLVKVADSKGEDLTQTGMFMGSPKYMSPEQIRGDRVDGRTDVYALGIILYEMLTGKVPFDRSNSVNILMAHVGEEALPMRQVNPAIALSPGLEEVVARCMAKDPERRFRSMDDVLASLKRVSGITAGTITGLEATERGSLTTSASGPVLGNHASSAVMPVGGTDPSRPPVFARSPHSGPGELASHAGPAGARVSAGWLAAGVLGSLLAAALVVYWVSERGTAPQSAPAARAAAPSTPRDVPSTLPAMAVATLAPPPEAVAPAAAPIVPLVKIRVQTEPDGADVKEEGVEQCASTPCDIVYKGEEADPAREHKLTFAHPGYRVEVRSVKTSDSPLSVKLAPMPRAVPAAPPRVVESPPPVPTGYKTDIPY